MNFIFISPQFPTNYYHFCAELKNNGVNVLGIGDSAYDSLPYSLKNVLTEYYKVESMENYDQMMRAVAYFTFKYGRIDWLESNNEYWLTQDARLRTDFHITSGFQLNEIEIFKSKKHMKEYYKKAGVPAVECYRIGSREGCFSFAAKYGYPIVVKPDNGVGAQNTYRISNDQELDQFFAETDREGYLAEPYVDGTICSYDAIINSKGDVLFESGNVTPVSIMDIVNNKADAYFYIEKQLPDDVRDAGRRCVKAFDVKSRFIHFEFFRLNKDMPGVANKGEIIALEVNMRPSGGFTPDMLNYANSTNVYKIWADMIAFGGTDMPVGEHYYCPFAGRRDGKNFVYSHEQIMQKYQQNMRMVDRIPEALSGAMGNQMYVATFSTREEMEQFYSDVLAVNDPVNAKVQKELAEVLALGEPTTTALTEKPNLSPAVKPTTAVTKTRSRKK